jgi:predicted transcriptional regulator
MRPRVEWMTRADDYILEFFEDTSIVATPHVVSANIDYSRQYVNRRIRQLADHDLLENTGDGLYQITDRGKAYLAGDLDADDLSDSD